MITSSSLASLLVAVPGRSNARRRDITPVLHYQWVCVAPRRGVPYELL